MTNVQLIKKPIDIKKLFNNTLRALTAIVAILGSLQKATATHIRAGEIIVKSEDCPIGRTYQIKLIGYTDTKGATPPVLFGDGLLDFGDGSEPLFVPSTAITPQPVDGEDDIAYNEFVVEHTYDGPGAYVISYRELNRNAEVLNIFNSVQTPFYVETRIIIDNFIGCNDTPVLTVPPIDRGCTGVAFTHNAGAFDPDSDSISYEFTIPKSDVGINVVQYRDPNVQEFYGGLNYAQANEDGNGRPTFTIDSQTGDVIWDAPGNSLGEYNIAFRIVEWRKIDGVFTRLGYVTRDMQIIIEGCDNERPRIEVPNDICVEAGTLIQETIFTTDPDGDPVIMEAFSQIFDLSPPAMVDPNTPRSQPTTPDPARLAFEWQTSCSHIRRQPYPVVFKATDVPDPSANRGVKLASFETWNITVIPPRPDLLGASLNPTARTVDLIIGDYAADKCDNASNIQVWRRVDSFALMPDSCDTGMPANAGYELIDRIPPGQTLYTDTNNGEGLSFGARYCYRLVAEYVNPDRGESLVSVEQCIVPVPAAAPVITNVSVATTDADNGEIRVRWTPPFDLDPGVFPPPYAYRVYRAAGFSGGTPTEVTSGTIADTTLLDTGIDTENLAHRYWVEVYFNGGTSLIETSDTASSVRLQPTPRFQSVLLEWEADVPWSNNIQQFPFHYVYRGVEGQKDDELALIDSVNVNLEGFTYLDQGQSGGAPLEETQIYCYRVLTRGSYGNPAISVPLENFSQTICAQPSDSVPPCAPLLALEKLECRGFCDDEDPRNFFLDDKPCEFNGFENRLTLSLSDPECAQDLAAYYIYYSPSDDSTGFRLIDTVMVVGDPSLPVEYVHSTENPARNPLQSFKGCYRITAVDRSGNPSEFSNTECNDNCPNFCLPNVFTPTVSRGFNDTFTAFNDALPNDGEGEIDPNRLRELRLLCPRFVQSVNFTVYNRWGKEVYNFSSTDGGGENSVLINWDGRNSSGTLLSAGVYYYAADVTFDVIDPNKRKQLIKGWVHLLY